MKHTISRRRTLVLAGGALATPMLASGLARAAEDWPTKPVRYINSFPAGGPTDVLSRVACQKLSELTGQQFIVENKAGAGGNIAVEAVARAPADGYTLLQLNVANAINTALYEKLNFNLLNDIVPVASFMRVPNVMEVTLSLPVKTVPEFIAYARANPGKISLRLRVSAHRFTCRVNCSRRWLRSTCCMCLTAASLRAGFRISLRVWCT